MKNMTRRQKRRKEKLAETRQNKAQEADGSVHV